MLSTGAIKWSLTNGCNAVTKDHTNSQSIHYTSAHRVLLHGSNNRNVVPIMAVTSQRPNGVKVSLTKDSLSYKERFMIRCREVGFNRTATIEAIADLLQEVFGNQAKRAGFSTDVFPATTTMRKLNLIWVISRMHIEISRYPTWGNEIEIETWCQREGRIANRRDWVLKDHANGEVIGRATSKWVMMNQYTRRLQKVSDDVRDEYLGFFPKTSRLAFPEDNNNSLKKIRKLEDQAVYSRLGLAPRRADLDMNEHVNNVTYIAWVLESIPKEVIDTHELQSITLDYKHECQHDDIVDSLTTPEPLDVSSNGSIASKENGENLSKFLHSLRLSGDGLEINRCRTEWRKKPVNG